MKSPIFPSHTILDSLSCAILVLDKSHAIRYVNETALQLFEQSASTLLKLHIDHLIEGEFIEHLANNTLRYPYTPFTQRNVTLTLAPAQRIEVDLIVSELPLSHMQQQDHEDWQILVEVHPLDRLTIIARNSQLEYHHEAIKQLSRNLAHEIKNPLGGILGAAQLLEDKLDKDDTELLGIISDEVSRLQRLVDDMLGPNQPIAITHFNIHRLLTQITKLVLAENPQLIFKTDYDPSIPEIEADFDRLSVVFLNLLVNASDAVRAATQTDTERCVTLITRIERQFTLNNKRHKMVIRVSIGDNGGGIPDSIRHQIFLPTITSKADGNGLGLAIAQNIAHQHHGMIDLEPANTQKHNTMFSVYLPLKQT